MSDKTGAPKSIRGGSGVIIGGLAVGALLGTPAAVSAAVAEPSTVVAGTGVIACQGPRAAADTPVTTFSEQFQVSFTAGAVTPTRTELTAIICDVR